MDVGSGSAGTTCCTDHMSQKSLVPRVSGELLVALWARTRSTNRAKVGPRTNTRTGSLPRDKCRSGGRDMLVAIPLLRAIMGIWTDYTRISE
jgi:hypothetical protein